MNFLYSGKNFSSLVTLINYYLYLLVKKIMDFIIFLVSKELSYKEIKKEDELNSIKNHIT